MLDKSKKTKCIYPNKIQTLVKALSICWDQEQIKQIMHGMEKIQNSHRKEVI